MKKILLISCMLLSFSAFAQTIVEVNSNITSNTTWTPNNIYILKGTNFIYVTNNAVLTVEPGTLVKGDPAALVVTRGSKLIAEGLAHKPIVFTSAKPAGQRAAGDWGGIVLLGSAKVNCPGGECTIEGGVDPVLGKYGGTDDASSVGSLKYVRIEFAGIAFNPNNETNGLTMGGVGNSTIIEYVQTSHGGDDAFEWFGGTVNGKYLVAYKTVDDMFDTDFGYIGNNQFVLGVSDPNVADISGSNAFEADNDATGTMNTPFSAATFSNATILGPQQSANGTINTNYRRGAHLRRATRQSIANSIITGFPSGLRLESAATEDSILSGTTQLLSNNIFAAYDRLLDSVNTKFQTLSDTIKQRNRTFITAADLNLNNPYASVPNALPNTGSPSLTGANFSKLSSYFARTTYVGAFGTNNWTNCWCEWDANNADYSAGLDYTKNISDFTFNVTDNVATFAGPTGNYTYDWNFGDFTTSKEQNPSHTYLAIGSYNVVLRVTNTRGCTAIFTKKVNITTGSKEVAITDDIITNTTWTNDKIYRLTGNACLFVRNNATLTIQPGTIVKGAPTALIITRGSKLIAKGTPEQPIVFTSAVAAGSRKAGDWGGLALLGAAKINVPGGESTLEGGCEPAYSKYGGSDDADSSGELEHVRIEFAGIAFNPNNELNTLTLAGVGSGTKISHVIASYGGDDAFEWFGGTVNGKYLVAYKTVDDMFDTDFGYTGKNQFLLGISDPNIADISLSNGFESDNDAQGSVNAPFTNSLFANVTLVGPRKASSDVINNNFGRSAHIRRSSRQDHYNSVHSGFPTGLRIESSNSINALLANELNIKSNVLTVMGRILDSTSTNFQTVLAKLLADGNTTVPNFDALGYLNPSAFDFRVSPNSILASGADQLAYADPHMTAVNYKGAFGENNLWTSCWAEYDPINTDYQIAPIHYFPQSIDFTSSISGAQVTCTPSLTGNLTYAWNFGDNTAIETTSNPTHTYTQNGDYQITLLITNARGCSKQIVKPVKVTTVSTKNNSELISTQIYPNPTTGSFILSMHTNNMEQVEIKLVDKLSRTILSQSVNLHTGQNMLPLHIFEKGQFILQVISKKGTYNHKIQVF